MGAPQRSATSLDEVRAGSNCGIASSINSECRDPKDIEKDELSQFFMTTFKDHNGPIAHGTYKGDSGPVSFRTMFFVPSEL